MLSVKVIEQFLRCPKILRQLPASSYISVSCPLNEILELQDVSLRVEDPADFPFVKVVDDLWQRYRWRLAGSTRCIVVD